MRGQHTANKSSFFVDIHLSKDFARVKTAQHDQRGFVRPVEARYLGMCPTCT